MKQTEQQREKLREMIAPLRSGKYPQAANRLRKPDGYCCLGVACDISGRGHWTQFGGAWYWYETDYGAAVTEDVYLPRIVQGVFGFAEQNPALAGDFMADLNNRGRSFAEIADLIEQEYLS